LILLPGFRRFFLLLLALVLLASCSKPLVREGAGEKEIYELGVLLIEKGDYQSAIEVFRELNNRYPSSPLVEKSMFQIAKAYYLDEQDVDAEVAFDDFIRLYPDSPLVPDALLLKGKTIERGMEKVGRDLDPAYQALKVYRRLVEAYPNSPQASEARARIKYIRNHLAENELEIGKFYLKRGKLGPAEFRLRRAIEQYGDVEAAPALAETLGLVYLKSGNREKAREMLNLLREKYPRSPEREEFEKIFQRGDD